MIKNISSLFVVITLCWSVAVSQVSVIGDLSNDKEAKPGERYDGVITVKNDSDDPQEVKVYQTDYLFACDGTNNYADPGTLARSNAKWVSFSPSFFTIPPRATTTVNYTVQVPMDSTASANDSVQVSKDSTAKKLVGSYWSMLMIEGIAKGSAESAAQKDANKPQMGIRQTIRYGIQVATHIAQTGTKKIDFLDAKLVTKDDGKKILQVDIGNSGDVWVRPTMYVELFDDKGVSKGKFPGVAYRLYPGTSVRQMIDLSTVDKGSYKALVVVDAGGEDAYGAEYNLKF
jgi:hypothetical protein